MKLIRDTSKVLKKERGKKKIKEGKEEKKEGKQVSLSKKNDSQVRMAWQHLVRSYKR